MRTPFDDVMVAIQDRGYHNHRKQEHSDLVCEGVFRDLLQNCKSLQEDFDEGEIGYWLNVRAPGGRGRKLDLVIGKPDPETGTSSIEGLRIGLENKSVITAHRNKSSRFDDLSETLDAILRVRPQAVMAATVMVGTAQRVLNIPDRVKQIAKRENVDFEREILPRLSKGETQLWDEFSHAISENHVDDASKTLDLFRSLKIRLPGHTHVHGYDYVLAVPVFIDNVTAPFIDRNNHLGINVDAHYTAMLDAICRAYKARWHA
jgi:hypothetical protein